MSRLRRGRWRRRLGAGACLLVGAGCRAGDPAGADWERAVCEPYVAAAGGEFHQGIADVATLSCLRRLGVPWHPSMLRWAAQRRLSLRTLRWMVEQGALWDHITLYHEVGNHWHRLHNNEDVVWFAERLGMRAVVAGSGAVGQ